MIGAEEIFALKGGTAINLFEWDLPRLSVDIDLTYLPNQGRPQVKVEVNPSLRGHLLPIRTIACSAQVQERFESLVETRCVSHGELFGGKICAALDRQHPRDLFDVRGLLNRDGISNEVRLGFIAALVSHGRPVSELIAPTRKDQRETFHEGRVDRRRALSPV